MKPMKVEFGKKTLSLVLDGKATVDIEKRLGQSIFGILMNGNGGFKMPRLGEMLTILHATNQTANIKMADMPELYDEYVASGGSMMKLVEVIQKLMEEAGFFGSEEETDKTDLIGDNPEDESLV
ncbi:DUF6096 family protein [Enterococcus sp. AZ103]|uniref:DUF6096 family protein n=1 Tax=Enterococcus sp. AZ103 TaxID=2774628 RepID=UPI003F277597